MTIILFLVDTSSSMCQKAYVNGVQKTYLDIAKGAVETFLKYRQRTQDCLGDRYMLLTFEEPPANVKAGWKENHATFMNELKNLQSTGLTSMGESLKNAFDLLNLNRMQSGIDTYGQGRCPFYLEPSVIIVITDGGRYSNRNVVHQDIILPLNTQIPGTKFTKEPFRWDQRLFSLVLRMSGNRMDERVEGKVPHDDSPIERMCEVTGGRSYRVRSHYVLNQCIESLVQKVQPGVVLQFEPLIPKDPNNMPNEALQDLVFQPLKKMIYVQKHISQKTFPIGYWPLPEPYWPDPKAPTLPPRDAHPKLKVVTPAVDEPQTVHNFPVDKYEIEASPLTLQILQKREMKKCWQVIISNGMHGFELPFGYLKASSTSSQVHLYVLAYNYPALLPLLHDLIHKYNMSPPNDLMYKFNAYVRSIPPYYCPFLRKALLNILVPYQLLQFLLPDNVDNYLSPNIANQLKHIKNTAKQDQENLCMKVYKQLKQPKPPYRQVETAKLNPGVPLRRDLVRHPLLRDSFAKLHSEIEPLENYTVVVPQLTRQQSAKSYRNPFDIPRRDIIEEIGRMREAFMRPQPVSLVAKDSGHCLPIAEMGNYQEYLKNKDNPLREIEPTNVRQHMFGNPYKKDKHMVMVDEADLGDVAAPMKGNGAGTSGVPGVSGVGGAPGKKLDSSRVRKRKAGPIRMDYVFRRTSTDSRPRTPTPSCSGVSPGSSSGMSSSAMSSNASSVSSLSDLESMDSDSDASSMSSGMSEDGDPDRLVVAFPDFPDEEATEPEFFNGYVRDFINGVGVESSCDNPQNNDSLNPAGSLLNAAGTVPTTQLVNGQLGGVVPPNMSPHSSHMSLPTVVVSQPISHQQPPQSPASSPHPYMTNYAAALGPHEPSTPPPPAPTILGQPSHLAAVHSIPLNGNIYGMPNSLPMTSPSSSTNGGILATSPSVSPYSSALPHVMPAQASTIQTLPQTLPGNSSGVHHPVSQSAVVQATAGVSHHLHDINDAQEISRILQQCHNGNSASSLPVTSTTGAVSASVDSSTAVDSSKLDNETALMPPPTSVTPLSSFLASSNFDSLKREAAAANGNTSATSVNSHTFSNHVNHSSTTTAVSLAPLPLTDEQKEQARKHNMDLRAQVFRDIRRPGRNYSQLLEHLNLIKGDDDMKSKFIQMCITESLRFRRKQMVNSIQEWWDKKQQLPATS
ncbi:integrator complex subunit 6 [Musca domestica]|uniref:Integrator complex subunit 6 n=1 Tax=Musca domestica TaxID=7370 RepID=A0A9J7HYS0_MUSDO|nr:integrator complex subunit 6 [Musca domestica]